MPRQRTIHGGTTYPLTEDFPERLKQFQEESGLSDSEIARRLGTYRINLWRWASGRTRPNYQSRRAMLELAKGLGLAHIFNK